MKDEQIKQNAETAYPGFEDLQTVHIEGAHSRDEEIEELKEEIESLKENEKELFEGFKKRGTKLGELMKENVKLRNDNKDLEQALACAEDVVDTQRKELEKLRNPWISVEELLPEEGQAVIVRLAFGAGNHAVCNYSNGQFVWALCIEASNVNIQSMLKLPAITHWMPIPDVPKV